MFWSCVFSDMASVGPLLLLMMSAFFIISSVTTSRSADQSKHKKPLLEKLKQGNEKLKSALKNKENLKNIGELCLTLITGIGDALKDTSHDILKSAASVASVVPVVGAVFSLLMTILEKHHRELKWNIWAAATYSKPEMKIRTAWTEYKTLLGSLAGAKDQDERKRHEKSFIEAYSKYEKAPREMGELLKKTGKSFVNNLGDELAEYVKCHEKEIIEYTYLILTLIFKGNMMNQFYYRLKNIQSEARNDEMKKNVYEAMTAMFEIQKQCIDSSMTYVKQDVKPLIDKSKKRDDLAQEVWDFLQKTYDRYDWMVVGFITKKSRHKTIKTLNKHVLTGFQDVSTERITVAVSRQVKGTQSKVQEVSTAIEKCIKKKVLCYKVEETLRTCGEKVAGIPMSQTYTEGNRKANVKDQADDEDEVSAAPENPSDQTPYIYTGEYPCAKQDCGQRKGRGKCVKMKDMFLGICQCNYPYYGLHCENDINDYAIELEKEAGTQKNKPTVTGKRSASICLDHMFVADVLTVTKTKWALIGLNLL
uniref:EGF-like domain-containing protein n=1 Tax=Maylandia zebra TaxID=106582 RepID=A0A3P9DDC9_9CICH